jgi:hypothetical protein
MLDIPQGPSFTIFDWLTIREQVRNQLVGLDIEVLSTVYGLSHLEGYEDLELCQEIDKTSARKQIHFAQTSYIVQQKGVFYGLKTQTQNCPGHRRITRTWVCHRFDTGSRGLPGGR